MAVARDFALGQPPTPPTPTTPRPSKPSASSFFRLANTLLHHPLFFAIVWLPFMLVIWQAQRARQALKRQAALKRVTASSPPMFESPDTTVANWPSPKSRECRPCSKPTRITRSR